MTTDTKSLILDLLEEEALMLAGLIAVHPVDDEFVWRLFTSLDVIRRRFLRRLEADHGERGENVEVEQAGSRPHPAIEEFLARLRSPLSVL